MHGSERLAKAARWVNLGIAAILCLAVSSCASASWVTRQKAPNYTPPARVFVHVEISREVEELDHGGQIAELVETLVDELRARGVRSELADRHDPKTYPRLDLFVTSSRLADPAVAAVAFTERSHLVVDCTLRSSPSAAPMLQGRIQGSSSAGNTYTEDLAAPKYVARTIAEAVAARE